jgi:tungstate transport system ATP-binding protein
MGGMEIKTAYRIRSLTHAYDGRTVLDIPRLDIPAGQICLFTGPNGSGKTTLLSILALLQAPSAGAVHLNGIECTPDPDRALRRAVTLVHQKPVLFSTSVRYNLAYGLIAHGHNAGEIDRRLNKIEKEMQLSALIDKHARKLSGGESQRVVLARALVLETPILLLDEPTNSLDNAYRPMLSELLRKANRDRGTTVIVATHDSHFIPALEGKIFQMDDGRILD